MWINTTRQTTLALDRRRWLLALVWMVFLPTAFQLASGTANFFEAIAHLAVIGVTSGLVATVLLYRNDALLRLIRVDMGRAAA